MAYLEISKDDVPGVERFEVAAAPITIGRAPTNALILPHSAISREHCVIDRQNGHFVIRDLGSANGLRVNGELARDAASLHDGDLIRMGPFTLVLHDLVRETPLVDLNGGAVPLAPAVDEPAAQRAPDPQIAILESALKESRAAIDAERQRSQNETTTLQQRIDALERESAEANARLCEAEGLLDSLQIALDNAHRARDEATAKQNASQAERDEVMQKIAELESQEVQRSEQRARLDAVEAELAAAHASLRTAEGQLTDRNTEIESLRSAVAEVRTKAKRRSTSTSDDELQRSARLKELEESNAALRTQADSLRSRIHAAEQRLQQRTEEVESLRDELARAAEGVQSPQDELDSLRAMLDQANERATTIEIEHGETSAQLRSALTELETMRQRAGEYAAKVREWQQTADAERIEHNAAMAAQQRAIDEVQSLTEAVKRTESARDEAMAHAAQYREQVEAGEQTLAAAQTQCKALEGRLIDSQSRIAELVETVKSLETERDHAQAGAAGLEITLEERSESLRIAELEREALREEVDRLHACEPQLAEARARITKLEAVLARGRAALHNAHDEAEFAQRECDNLVRQLHTVEGQRDRELERSALLDAECNDLRAKQSQLERDLHRARVTAETLRSKLQEDESVLDAIRAAIGQTQAAPVRRTGVQTTNRPADGDDVDVDDHASTSIHPGDSTVLRAMQEATATTSNARDANAQVLAAIFDKGKRRRRVPWIKRWKDFIG